MTLDDKELMGRYIYQVIRRLSRAQRDEVRMELEELISDMYADKGSMEEVLTQLGLPDGIRNRHFRKNMIFQSRLKRIFAFMQNGKKPMM